MSASQAATLGVAYSHEAQIHATVLLSADRWLFVTYFPEATSVCLFETPVDSPTLPHPNTPHLLLLPVALPSPCAYAVERLDCLPLLLTPS